MDRFPLANANDVAFCKQLWERAQQHKGGEFAKGVIAFERDYEGEYFVLRIDNLSHVSLASLEALVSLRPCSVRNVWISYSEPFEAPSIRLHVEIWHDQKRIKQRDFPNFRPGTLHDVSHLAGALGASESGVDHEDIPILCHIVSSVYNLDPLLPCIEFSYEVRDGEYRLTFEGVERFGYHMMEYFILSFGPQLDNIWFICKADKDAKEHNYLRMSVSRQDTPPQYQIALRRPKRFSQDQEEEDEEENNENRKRKRGAEEAEEDERYASRARLH